MQPSRTLFAKEPLHMYIHSTDKTRGCGAEELGYFLPNKGMHGERGIMGKRQLQVFGAILLGEGRYYLRRVPTREGRKASAGRES